MKSRWTTYLLLAAVLAVWGVVAWKIIDSSSDAPVTPSPLAVAEKPIVKEPDTLWLDYPDPFLKGASEQIRTTRPVVRSLPPAPKARREKVAFVHLGAVTAKGRTLQILTIENRQVELARGETVDGFVLAGWDADSLYLNKDGILYGVKRCE